MSFNNSHNQKRVQKILETLELIDKSANSNKVDASDVADLLSPVINKIGEYTPTVKPKNNAAEKPNVGNGSLHSYVDTLDKYQLCTLISLAAIRLETKHL